MSVSEYIIILILSKISVIISKEITGNIELSFSMRGDEFMSIVAVTCCLVETTDICGDRSSNTMEERNLRCEIRR